MINRDYDRLTRPFDQLIRKLVMECEQYKSEREVETQNSKAKDEKIAELLAIIEMQRKEVDELRRENLQLTLWLRLYEWGKA